MIKRVWVKFLIIIFLGGLLLLAYSFYFKPSRLWVRAGGFEAFLGGVFLILISAFFAKRTYVQKEIDQKFGELIEKLEHEEALSAADLLNCKKCEKLFSKDEIQGYVCPFCGADLSLPEKRENG